MSGWKKAALRGLGYAGFFLAAFPVCLYLTFNPDDLAPLIKEQAQQKVRFLKDKDLDIEDISLYRVFGLEFKGVTISPKTEEEGEPVRPLKIERLAVRPKLSTIIAQARGGAKKRRAPVSASFVAELAGGELSGEYKSIERSYFLRVEIEDKISLDKLTFPSEKFRELRMAGSILGELQLASEDAGRPGALDGEIKIDLDQPAVRDLKSYMLNDLSMKKGTLIATIEDGVVDIDTFKLTGDDLPVNLTGTLTLQNPWSRSILNVKGSVQQGEQFKNKNPVISAMMSGGNKFEFNGPIENLGMF